MFLTWMMILSRPRNCPTLTFTLTSTRTTQTMLTQVNRRTEDLSGKPTEDVETNVHLVGCRTSNSAKSSNFEHPYCVVQKVTTGPCGAGVAISHAQAIKGVIKITIFLLYPWSLVKTDCFQKCLILRYNKCVSWGLKIIAQRILHELF